MRIPPPNDPVLRSGLGKAPDRSGGQAGHLLLEPEHASLINIGTAFVMTVRAQMPRIVVPDDFKPAFVDVKMSVTLFNRRFVCRSFTGIRIPPLCPVPGLLSDASGMLAGID